MSAKKSSTLRMVLVAVAIVAMVGSGAVSYFLVNENNKELQKFRKQSNALEKQVQVIWQDIIYQSQLTNTAIILWREEGAAEDIIKYLTLLKLTAEATSQEVLARAETLKQQKLSLINNAYAERIKLTEEIDALDQENENYMLLAFMMQMVGLVLVIATRDMA